MNWKTKDTPPLVANKPIIIATKDKESGGYRYNVVFYYEPMGLFYGGPGIKVKVGDIDLWSEVAAPTSGGSD